MKLIIIGITVLAIFVLIGLWWMLKNNKTYVSEHFTGGAVLEGIVQSKNGFSIRYNNNIVFKSQKDDDSVYSIRIPSMKPGDIVYFQCKSDVPASQGAFFRAELNIGSMRQFYTGRDFRFMGTILPSDGSTRGDRYMGCGVGTDNRTLQYDVGNGYSRDSCREIAKNWGMPYYGLYGGGFCKVGFPETVPIEWEDKKYVDAENKPYTRREVVKTENRNPFFYGNVDDSNCSTQCIWDKPGENCGTSNNMSVYAINEMPTQIIADVSPNSKFSSDTKPIWVKGGAAGVHVATLTIPNFDILEFCSDINYTEFNAAGCENGTNEPSCTTSSLVNYKPVQQLCQTKYDWTDIGAFQYLMRKVFAYLKLIPLQLGYKIANTDISMYAFSGAYNDSVPCHQADANAVACNPQFGQVKIDSNGGWVSDDTEAGYVTIKLSKITKVYGIATQSTNFPVELGMLPGRVLSYSVYYSTNIDDKDQSSWIKVDNKIFDGNDSISTDNSLKKINFFDTPVEAIRIRISTETHLHGPAMRVDIIIADDSPYQPSVNIIRNPKEVNSASNAFINLHDITNVNSIRSIKTKMDNLNKGTGFANASVYIKQFMDANYEMIILLKVIADKIKYPIDTEQLTADKLVLPDSPMYYNIIIKASNYNLTEALSINFKRVFKNLFMYGRLVAETPEIIRVCSCMENPIDLSKQQCAPC
jgi:hypothetical protein